MQGKPIEEVREFSVHLRVLDEKKRCPNLFILSLQKFPNSCFLLRTQTFNWATLKKAEETRSFTLLTDALCSPRMMPR